MEQVPFRALGKAETFFRLRNYKQIKNMQVYWEWNSFQEIEIQAMFKVEK